jgi:bacterioferritin
VRAVSWFGAPRAFAGIGLGGRVTRGKGLVQRFVETRVRFRAFALFFCPAARHCAVSGVRFHVRDNPQSAGSFPRRREPLARPLRSTCAAGFFDGSAIHIRKGLTAMGDFLSDIGNIRKRAREHMSDGAITDGYKADRDQVVKLLNDVLATELVCVLRYKRHYYMAEGFDSEAIKAEFLEHAKEEQTHADMVAERITQLGGEPDFNPKTLLTRSHSEYVEGKTLRAMVEEDLVAERIAVETYSEIARWLGTDDPTSRRVIEQILEKEEEHAEDLVTLLGRMEQPGNKKS